MNASNAQEGSAKMDRFLLLLVILMLAALSSLRGYGAAGALKLLLCVADAVVDALVAFSG